MKPELNTAFAERMRTDAGRYMVAGKTLAILERHKLIGIGLTASYFILTVMGKELHAERNA